MLVRQFAGDFVLRFANWRRARLRTRLVRTLVSVTGLASPIICCFLRCRQDDAIQAPCPMTGRVETARLRSGRLLCKPVWLRFEA